MLLFRCDYAEGAHPDILLFTDNLYGRIAANATGKLLYGAYRKAGRFRCLAALRRESHRSAFCDQLGYDPGPDRKSSQNTIKKGGRFRSPFLLTGFRLLDNGAGNCVFVVLLIHEDILLVRIDVALLGDADDPAKCRCIGK